MNLTKEIRTRVLRYEQLTGTLPVAIGMNAATRLQYAKAAAKAKPRKKNPVIIPVFVERRLARGEFRLWKFYGSRAVSEVNFTL